MVGFLCRCNVDLDRITVDGERCQKRRICRWLVVPHPARTPVECIKVRNVANNIARNPLDSLLMNQRSHGIEMLCFYEGIADTLDVDISLEIAVPHSAVGGY